MTADGAALRNLIVTGDDFGLSHEVNQAILLAHRDGILTSASLMVNEPGFVEAVSLARETPTLAVGLHLALSLSSATLPAARLPDLVDAQGRFCRSPARAGWRYFFRTDAPSQLEAEIRAQIEKFLSTGLPLDHVDGHQHLHLHPSVFPILVRVSDEYRIPGLRILRDSLAANVQVDGLGALSGAAHRWTFGLLAVRARRALRDRPVVTPDRVIGFLQDGRLVGSRLRALLGTVGDGVTEVYCHPSLRDASPDRQCRREFEALVDPETWLAVEAAGLRRTSYGRLAEEGRSRPAAEASNIAGASRTSTAGFPTGEAPPPGSATS